MRAEIGAYRRADHGRDRPAEKYQPDCLAARFRRHHQACRCGGLGGEQRCTDRGDHARRKQGVITGRNGRNQMHDGVDGQRRRQQLAPFDRTGPAGEKRAADTDRGCECRDQGADCGRRNEQIGAEFIEHAGHDHRAGADGEIT